MRKLVVRVMLVCLVGAAGCAAKTPLQAPTTAAPVAPTLPIATAAPRPTATLSPPTATPAPTPTPTPTPNWPVGMDALGPTASRMVNNEAARRWEYVGESGAGPVVAYWDAGVKRLALVDGVASLDFAEHKGLFVRWELAQVEARFLASAGMAPPILVDVERGGLCEGKGGRWGIGLRDLPAGTAVRSPFAAAVARSVITTSGLPDIHEFHLSDPEADREVLRVFLTPDLEELTTGDVVAGGVLFETGGVKLTIANPCGATSEMMFTNADERDAGTRIADLMRDELGRLVLIAGG